MKIEDIGEVIASRVLQISVNGEPPKNLVVRLGKPRQFSESGDHICPFDIKFADDTEPQIRCAFGVDAFQAIQLVLPSISSMVHGYNYMGSTGQVRSVEVWWLEKGDDCGFPLT